MRSILLAAALIALPLPAFACTVAPGYRTPTNFELVEAADVIVLAKVEELKKNDPDRYSHVALKPVKTLKGSGPGDAIIVTGTTTSAPEYTPLDKAHPSVQWGACERTSFSRGTLVVAMLKQTPTGLEPLDFAFARTIEDVQSKHGLWVHAVEDYVKLLDVPKEERRAAIEAEVTRLEAELEDRQPALALAKDLRAHLAATAAK